MQIEIACVGKWNLCSGSIYWSAFEHSCLFSLRFTIDVAFPCRIDKNRKFFFSLAIIIIWFTLKVNSNEFLRLLDKSDLLSTTLRFCAYFQRFSFYIFGFLAAYSVLSSTRSVFLVASASLLHVSWEKECGFLCLNSKLFIQRGVFSSLIKNPIFCLFKLFMWCEQWPSLQRFGSARSIL